MESARNFRNYKVWQEAVNYATKVYKVTAEMPWFEKKGLCDQLQRAAVSISPNIAEGSAKPSNADFARFLDTALGSAYEVETTLCYMACLVNISLKNNLYYGSIRLAALTCRNDSLINSNFDSVGKRAVVLCACTKSSY